MVCKHSRVEDYCNAVRPLIKLLHLQLMQGVGMASQLRTVRPDRKLGALPYI